MLESRDEANLILRILKLGKEIVNNGAAMVGVDQA